MFWAPDSSNTMKTGHINWGYILRKIMISSLVRNAYFSHGLFKAFDTIE